MKKHLFWYLVAIGVLAVLVLGIYLIKTNRISSGAAGAVASLALSPNTGTYTVGQNFDVAINLNTGGAYVDGVDIVSLRFPVASLRATQVRAGSITAFTLSPATITPDNTTGKITFVAYVASGSAGYTGSGSVAIVTFQALANSTAPVSFDFNAAVPSTTDCNVAEHGTGSDILGSVTNGSYTLQTVNTVNIISRLQGRTNFSTTNSNFKILTPGTSTAVYTKSDVVTDANGNASFTVTGVSAGTYDFRIKSNMFLSKTLRNVVLANPITLDFTTLKSGDLNNDDIVNSLDFSVLNGKWLLQDPAADINIDGIVNTIDYSLLNGNWLLSGQ